MHALPRSGQFRACQNRGLGRLFNVPRFRRPRSRGARRPLFALSAACNSRAFWLLLQKFRFRFRFRFALVKLSLARGVEIAIATIPISVPWMLRL